MESTKVDIEIAKGDVNVEMINRNCSVPLELQNLTVKVELDDEEYSSNGTVNEADILPIPFINPILTLKMDVQEDDVDETTSRSDTVPFELKNCLLKLENDLEDDDETFILPNQLYNTTEELAKGANVVEGEKINKTSNLLIQRNIKLEMGDQEPDTIKDTDSSLITVHNGTLEMEMNANDVHQNWRERDSLRDAYNIIFELEKGLVQKMFQCVKCHSSFRQESDLLAHLETDSKKKKKCVLSTKLGLSTKEGKPFECTTCKKSFEKKDAFVKHLRTHRLNHPYRCTMCDSYLKTKTQLLLHMRRHRKETMLKCLECDKTFIHEGFLSIHKKTHKKKEVGECTSNNKSHNKKMFICGTCGESFRAGNELSSHEKSHTNEKPLDSASPTQVQRIYKPMTIKQFKCETCQETFFSKGALSNHSKSHLRDIWQYKCDLCGRWFRNQHGLSIHISVIHEPIKTKAIPKTNEKAPFKCSTCNLTFLWKSYLSAHMSTHAPQIPFKWNIGDKTYTRKNPLSSLPKTSLDES